MKGSVEMIKTEKLTIKRIKVIDGKKVAEEKALIKTDGNITIPILIPFIFP